MLAAPLEILLLEKGVSYGDIKDKLDAASTWYFRRSGISPALRIRAADAPVI